MKTFGQRMAQAIKDCGMGLEQVAAATGLEIDALRSLERDDYGALPGDEIIAEKIRSFARLVNADPDDVLSDYQRERQRWLAAAQLGEKRSRPSHGRKEAIAILTTGIIALGIGAFLLSSPGKEAGADRASFQAPKPQAAQTPDPGEPPRQIAPPEPAPARIPEPPAPSAPPAIAPPGEPGLSITDRGVGKGIVRHDLVGEASRFNVGDRVYFWTRIEGAETGASIVHVWMHQGEEKVRVPLRVGGARWRTHSHKDLRRGSEGTWAVEARDEAGRVLARSEFLVPS